MKCKCGEQGELKVFNTFQYYFCNKCKKEIEECKIEENPNNASVDDFYLDLAYQNIKSALKNINDYFQRDQGKKITITIPTSTKLHYKIYRNTQGIYRELHVKSDSKNWEIIERK